MLSHDEYELNFDHGPVTPMDMFRPRVIPVDVIGVDGVGHIIGGLGEVTLICDMMLDGFATETALMQFLGTLMNKALTLVGDLSETLYEGETTTFPECTLWGVRPVGRPAYDASGQNGWFMPVVLVWIQRVPSPPSP